MSIPTFPLPYSFRKDVEETAEYINRTVVFESQKKQKQRVAIGKTETWKIYLQGSTDDRLILKNFHDSVAGDYGTFYFNTPDGTQVVARFADGKLPITDIRALDMSNPTGGKVVGYTCEITVERVL